MKPSKPIVFNNAPAVMVSRLSEAVTNAVGHFPILSGLFVSVEKSDQYDRQAIMFVNGSAYLNNGTSKEVGFNLNLYAENFDNLIELGNALETVINSIRGGGVRYCQIDMPALEVPEDEETNFHSFLTFTAVLAGRSL